VGRGELPPAAGSSPIYSRRSWLRDDLLICFAGAVKKIIGGACNNETGWILSTDQSSSQSGTGQLGGNYDNFKGGVFLSQKAQCGLLGENPPGLRV